MWYFRVWFSKHGGVGLMVGLDLRGLLQPMILWVYERFRCHVATAHIHIQFLWKISSVIREQVLQQAVKRSFRFLETSGMSVEITGKFATASYQRCNEDRCFSSMFPVGASSSKVTLTSGFCRYRLNISALKVPWCRIQSFGLSPTVLIFVLEGRKVPGNPNSRYYFPTFRSHVLGCLSNSADVWNGFLRYH